MAVFPVAVGPAIIITVLFFGVKAMLYLKNPSALGGRGNSSKIIFSSRFRGIAYFLSLLFTAGRRFFISRSCSSKIKIVLFFSFLGKAFYYLGEVIFLFHISKFF